MKFNITFGAIIKELRTYIALGLNVISMVLNIPSSIFSTLSKWINPN